MKWNMSPLELKQHYHTLCNKLKFAEEQKLMLASNQLRSRIVYIKSKYRERTGKEIDN